MRILSTTRTVKHNGVIAGTIRVADGQRRHHVKYERARNGHAEQWGAPTEVLCFTYSTFDHLIQFNPHDHEVNATLL